MSIQPEVFKDNSLQVYEKNYITIKFSSSNDRFELFSSEMNVHFIILGNCNHYK